MIHFLILPLPVFIEINFDRSFRKAFLFRKLLTETTFRRRGEKKLVELAGRRHASVSRTITNHK